VVYYASEKRRLTIPITAELREESLGILAKARAQAEGGIRPPPLVNDRKCPRCSLQPFCLPDEINFEKAGGPNAPEEFSPRRILPKRDDGIHLVALSDGVRIGVSGESLRLSDKDGKLVREAPLADVESLTVMGNVQVTTQAIHALSSSDTPVAWVSYSGRLIASMDTNSPASAVVLRGQVRTLDDPEKALFLARALVAAKITNQRTLLMRNHPALPDGVARDLGELAGKAQSCQRAESLLGIEGAAAAVYFRHFSALFPTEFGTLFEQNGRQRRPPPDPVNAVLSFGYSMLVHECVAALRIASLQPTIGAYHSTRPGRPALALDLMEPFRPLIADSVAVSAFNRNEFSPGHFNRTAAGCVMTDHGRRAFFSALGRRYDTEITHPVFEYRLSYRRMIVLHARMISAWMLGEIPTLHFLTTR
jgi:CRISPR-associated protein Cas1